MSRLITRCLTGLFVLFVVTGIGFGASQAFGSTRLTDDYCGKYSGDLGCCPPYTGYTCSEACRDFGYEGGLCIRIDNDDPESSCGLCCTCLY